MSLLEKVKIFRVMGGSTVGNGGAGVTTFVDAAGAGGVLFLMTCSSACKSTGTIIVQQSSAASTGAGIFQSTFSNIIKGTTSTAIDVAKPLKRYVRLKLLTCTGIAVTPIAYNLGQAGSTQLGTYLNTYKVDHDIDGRESGVHVCTS